MQSSNNNRKTIEIIKTIYWPYKANNFINKLYSYKNKSYSNNLIFNNSINFYQSLV